MCQLCYVSALLFVSTSPFTLVNQWRAQGCSLYLGALFPSGQSTACPVCMVHLETLSLRTAKCCPGNHCALNPRYADATAQWLYLIVLA